MTKDIKADELISVIIPVYKVEKYLNRCIGSIVTQTYPNLEIIIVDDGSPDNCGAMCDEWEKKDSRIKVIHKENGGLSSARNAGLQIMNGKYITFVDSDDWLVTNAIEYLYKLLTNTGADFAMGGNIRTTEYIAEEKSLHQEHLILERKDFLLKFFKYGTQENVQYACGKLFRKELFQDVRFPVGMTCEDVPTIFQIILRSDRIAYSDENIYYYFYNNESITGKKSLQTIFDLEKAWDIVCEEARKCDVDEIKHAAKINRIRVNLGILFSFATMSEKDKYIKKRKQAQKSLRDNLMMLLKSKIVFSRKLMIVVYSISILIGDFIVKCIGKKKCGV